MFAGSYVHLAGGAVFTMLLLAGCITDLRIRKIPNELVIAILVTGWLFALASPQFVRSLGMSAAGTAIGFAIWIPFYLLGVIGAGDVKFFAAAGAWLGPELTWRAALIAALVGGVLAIVYLLSEKRLGATLRRLALAASSRSVGVVAEPSNSGTKRRPLPYGVALAIGALAAAWLPRLP